MRARKKESSYHLARHHRRGWTRRSIATGLVKPMPFIPPERHPPHAVVRQAGLDAGVGVSGVTKSRQDLLVTPRTGTGGRGWNGLHEFPGCDRAGADRAATPGAKILMKFTRGQHQK